MEKLDEGKNRDVLNRWLINAANKQEDIGKAAPIVEQKTAELVSKGRWSVPGYKVRTAFLRPFLLDSKISAY